MKGRQDTRRLGYIADFSLVYAHRTAAWRSLTQTLMDQLDRCADDSARRLLLGVSERFAAGEGEREQAA